MPRLALHAFLKARVDSDSLVLGVRLFYVTHPVYIGTLASFFDVGCGAFSSVAVPHLVTPFVWSIYRSSVHLCISVIRWKFLLSLRVSILDRLCISTMLIVVHWKTDQSVLF